MFHLVIYVQMILNIVEIDGTNFVHEKLHKRWALSMNKFCARKTTNFVGVSFVDEQKDQEHDQNGEETATIWCIHSRHFFASVTTFIRWLDSHNWSWPPPTKSDEEQWCLMKVGLVSHISFCCFGFWREPSWTHMQILPSNGRHSPHDNSKPRCH